VAPRQSGRSRPARSKLRCRSFGFLNVASPDSFRVYGLTVQSTLLALADEVIE
jgi:hypothetical protein